MKALRVGIIGCGGRGWAHASGYTAAGDRVILAACADIHKPAAERFKEKFGFKKIYTDYKEMLEKEKGISAENLLEKITTAVENAVKKDFGEPENVVIKVNREAQQFDVVIQKTVVEEVTNPANEILLDEAAKHAGTELKAIVPVDCGVTGERYYSMQYLVFDDAFRLPLSNGFCRLAY